ncbi:MAG: methyltransferase domain-containing protein [Chloroflexi bacterium]|nr:methyltransferase domain-containing protein [Chloroflexota bacterium]
MSVDPQMIQRAIAGMYDELSARYERVVAPVYRPMAKRLVQLIDLRPGWVALDAGAGTGLVALLAAPRVGKTGRIIGVDASEQMLAFARVHAAQFGFSQCEFRIGDLNALDLPEASCDAVLSQFALHYTDPARSLAEFYRVLKPDGILALQIWAMDSSAPHKTMYDVLTPYRAKEETDVLAHLRAQSTRAYLFRQTFGAVDQITRAVELAGFENVDARQEHYPARVADREAFLEFADASPLLHAEIAALPADVRTRYLDAARVALERFQAASGFAWTFHTLALIARK